ncbi:MAG: nucleoside triphosphatase, partial [Oscillospiraceae bacterium]|nr:nucleoside triphosphatase [Oscillospiraceae bacterium]
VSHTVFDRNTDLFNCQNGTLNLTTGEFRPHDPADFLTMMSGITYDPDATCPRWEQFISEVMCNDADLALYLQKALGYALTGDTSLECLFILYGATSRNGKGTTMETFLKIMGDYGKTSNPEMLSTKFGNTNASGPSEEIARLAGVRFVNISEPEKKITFNAALVKRMTGNDTLNARFLHENSFDFRPNFKIFINTNYKPSVSDMTLFYSCRLKLIPFKRHFEEHEQDKGLKAFFAEEQSQSAIFNWCYAGYKLFKKQGLDDPAAVTEATKEYQDESDRIGQFVDAWLEEGEAFEERTSAVYNIYGQWCEKYGYRKENSTNFKNAIQRFFPIVRKRPSDGSGGPTTMLVGCRFLKQEKGEVDKPEEFAALE